MQIWTVKNNRATDGVKLHYVEKDKFLLPIEIIICKYKAQMINIVTIIILP